MEASENPKEYVGYVLTFNLRKHGGERKPKGIRWVRIKHYVDDLIDVIGQLDTPQY
jgi:hypothetical protein